jgi:hypothetical protein
VGTTPGRAWLQTGVVQIQAIGKLSCGRVQGSEDTWVRGWRRLEASNRSGSEGAKVLWVAHMVGRCSVGYENTGRVSTTQQGTVGHTGVWGCMGPQGGVGTNIGGRVHNHKGVAGVGQCRLSRVAVKG